MAKDLQRRIEQSNFHKDLFLANDDKSEKNDSLLKLESEIKDINKILRLDQSNHQSIERSKVASRKSDSKNDTPIV